MSKKSKNKPRNTPRRERRRLAAEEDPWEDARASLAATKSLPPPNRPGRPTVRTEATAKIICECLARGLPQHMACSVAGISTETYKNWRSCEPLFNAQAERAVAEGVQARLKVVEKCAFESEDEAIRLRAACWMLEHVHPEHFAKNRIELTGADGAPLAAGIQLYLPKKDGAPAGEVVETRELTEGETSNGNGR